MRIAFVVQRYGEEVNGGAELLCRQVAERMHKYFSVEVLTTCALDYLTWENYFPAGATTINGIPVHRFPTDCSRDMHAFNRFAKKLFANPQRSLVDELAWIRLQGPTSSALLAYIKEHEETYHLFIFVTYSYLTTFLGLQLVSRKSVLIPTAHDEPHFYLDAYRPIFHLPQGICYNTEEERRLVQRQWQNTHIPWCVAGAGVITTTADSSSESEEATAVPLTFPQPYILYVGRIDLMKGCQELSAFFLRYLEERQVELNLVLLGKQAMDMPKHPGILAPGFVSSAQKQAALQGAMLVVNPSQYESLSFMVLEAWQAGIPVLVNGRSEVLAEHCLNSNGGLYYSSYDEFAYCLDLLYPNQEVRSAMGKQGQHYVAEHYSWDTIEKTYVDFLLSV
ncbi:hexosyltransferase [Candidatus Vecturithrix granuli]|uniref:Hexosyltransferase n=1 Tax=Vecturithrix granuli TaxID=1499967 RepID=A0A081CAR7_VECG1|nr:hexosyltransferase [Candidatus Vecturithrix granuli]